jgi:C4-dicarboxylate-specific signal transduction histidine kinase
MNSAALIRHRVELIREFTDTPALRLEKHKVLQILVNLIRNAKHALVDSEQTNRQLTVRVGANNGHVAISVSDNGVGISPENLTRVFTHGFTTKAAGHGFGLHNGVLAAQQMGGSLRVQSDGVGCGATFTLELPRVPEGATP